MAANTQTELGKAGAAQGADSIAPDAAGKLRALEERLRQLGSLMVAYSGGVDSAFLAATAHRVLGARMLAVLADSPSLARRDMEQACAFAQSLDMPLQVIATEELDRPEYARNDANRCFHCKDELFAVMEKLGAKLGFAHIAYGMNADDTQGLSARPARRGGARGAGAAGRGRADQAGGARAGQGGRLPGCGTVRRRRAFRRAWSTAAP